MSASFGFAPHSVVFIESLGFDFPTEWVPLLDEQRYGDLLLLAAEYGYMPVLEWLNRENKLGGLIDAPVEFTYSVYGPVYQPQTQHLGYDEDSDCNYGNYAFQLAVGNNQLEVLNWLKIQLDNKDHRLLDRMSLMFARFSQSFEADRRDKTGRLAGAIAFDTYYAFQLAVTRGHLEAMEWLAENIRPDQLRDMIWHMMYFMYDDSLAQPVYDKLAEIVDKAGLSGKIGNTL